MSQPADPADIRPCQSLLGRSAVVTGAAGGIGGAIALAFAREGAALALVDIDGDRLAGIARSCGSLAPSISAHIADVAVEDQVVESFAAAVKAHGRVDVLVNCAGLGDERYLTEMDTGSWDRILHANLRSVFLCCRSVLPGMISRRWGRIINIASQLGLKGGARAAHYSAAKSGVLGLTRALAREVVDDNVLVNAIAPGPVDTDMIRSLDPASQESKRASVPLRRLGLPAEIAPTAVLLAGDPAGNLYVGQTLSPDGGDVMH